ncbi:MAG: hypothetical protein A2148_09315 [Chloroflexi bacterium RBG_16_68_14]|nr:MAG: hypothetical protein A2148_09315 [Chloroflexi bacterium RBG_16_68_14]
MAATRPSARATVLRSALLFSPFLAVTLAAFAFILQDTTEEGMSGGSIVGLVLVGLVALLLAYQVVQSLRDLFSQPVQTTGLVERRWSRNDFFLFRNDYVFVEGNVFRLQPEQFVEVDLGDIVRVAHYPHTATVETIEVVERAGQRTRPDDG